MKTIIITTDFSKSALNAARYTAALAKSIGVDQLVLYHSYDKIQVSTHAPVTEVIPTLTRDQSLSDLKHVQAELETILGVDSGIKISLAANDLPLTHGVEQLAAECNAELVVAGSTGRTNLEQVLMGNNTTNLASSLKFPLLIVPSNALFVPIQSIVFACDLKKVSNSTPIDEIDQWLKSLSAKLLVLNVGLEGKRHGPDAITNQYKMHTLLDGFNPEYHYTEGDNIVEGIEDFAKDHSAGLIVTIPKSYGFFERLFRRSVSKQLVKKSNVPILILREKES